MLLTPASLVGGSRKPLFVAAHRSVLVRRTPATRRFRVFAVRSRPTVVDLRHSGCPRRVAAGAKKLDVRSAGVVVAGATTSRPAKAGAADQDDYSQRTGATSAPTPALLAQLVRAISRALVGLVSVTYLASPWLLVPHLTRDTSSTGLECPISSTTSTCR